jgi:endonuclease/exonuclease/phosphatase family metal-dependent hydrolase
MPTPLRFVTLNMHKGVSGVLRAPTSARLKEGLAHLDADLVAIQEMQDANAKRAGRRGWPQHAMTDYLAHGQYAHVAYGANAHYRHGHHGNALLSRHALHGTLNHDITFYRRLEARGALHVVVKVPDWRKPLHVVVTHLALMERGRRRQVADVLALVARACPAGEPVVVAGDFNDWRNRAQNPFGLQGFTDAYQAVHGKLARTFPAWLPVLPLDRVYVRGLAVRSASVLTQWRTVSDHLGLVVELVPEAR